MDEGQLRKACLEEETPRERRAHSHVERWSRIRTGGERTTDQEWGGGEGEKEGKGTRASVAGRYRETGHASKDGASGGSP